MKRILAILLALAMLLTLCAACQKTDTTTPDTTANTPADTTDTPSDTTDEIPIEEVPDQYKSTADVWSGITLSESPYGFNYDLNYNGRTDKTELYLHGAGSWPICDWGEYGFTMWKPTSDQILNASDNGATYGDVNFLWGITMEKTGVKITFECPSTTTAAEKFPLAIASGHYPDIMVNTYTYYAGGLAKALEDEVIADLTENVNNNMPNYVHWLNMTPANLKEGKLDDGTFAMIYSITMQVQPAFVGPMIRTDWLNDAGLDAPVTIDDWYNMLCVFRDNYSTGEPLDFSNGYDMSAAFTGAFDVWLPASNNLNGFYIQKDGIVEPSINNNDYREYLETMHKWYSEGLIDKDFVSAVMFDMSRIIGGETGAMGGGVFTMASDFYGKIAGDENMLWECFPNPIRSEGAERHIFYKGTTANALASGGVTLSAQLSEKELEVVCRMLDYQFTEEGTIAGQYGKEGTSFTFDENGHPFHTDLIINNPDSTISSSTAQELYMCNNVFGGKLIERETDVCDDIKKHHLDVWQEWGDWNLEGTLSYSSLDSAERAGLMTDCYTYVQEFYAKVIMGDIELNDATWNEYVETLNGYKIDRITELTQQAYDRYLQR